MPKFVPLKVNLFARRRMGTVLRFFFSIFTEGNKFFHFLLASLDEESSKMGATRPHKVNFKGSK